MSETKVVYNDPQHAVVKCRRLNAETETDWCLDEATQESLREHVKLLKYAYAEIERLTSLQLDQIVIGDRLVDANGDGQGIVLSTTHWDDRIKKAGLAGKWCQIIIQPVKPRGDNPKN